MEVATIAIWNINWVEGITSSAPPAPPHPHDDVANWLWPDDGCILWDNGGVIEL